MDTTTNEHDETANDEPRKAWEVLAEISGGDAPTEMLQKAIAHGDDAEAAWEALDRAEWVAPLVIGAALRDGEHVGALRAAAAMVCAVTGHDGPIGELIEAIPGAVAEGQKVRPSRTAGERDKVIEYRLSNLPAATRNVHQFRVAEEVDQEHEAAVARWMERRHEASAPASRRGVLRLVVENDAPEALRTFANMIATAAVEGADDAVAMLDQLTRQCVEAKAEGKPGKKVSDRAWAKASAELADVLRAAAAFASPAGQTDAEPANDNAAEEPVETAAEAMQRKRAGVDRVLAGLFRRGA